MTGVRPVTKAVRTSYCHVHEVDEEIPRRVYVVCFECGHAYTARELRRRWREEFRKVNSYGSPFGRIDTLKRTWKRARHIYFCQECIHDF